MTQMLTDSFKRKMRAEHAFFFDPCTAPVLSWSQVIPPNRVYFTLKKALTHSGRGGVSPAVTWARHSSSVMRALMLPRNS